MEQFTLLFEEFLMKAVTLTENFLAQDFNQETELENFTSNRERLFQIIEQISKQVNWNDVSEDKRTEYNRRLEYMKKLDEVLLVKLQEYQLEVKRDIEATVRQKDNIKGYNLSVVK